MTYHVCTALLPWLPLVSLWLSLSLSLSLWRHRCSTPGPRGVVLALALALVLAWRGVAWHLVHAGLGGHVVHLGVQGLRVHGAVPDGDLALVVDPAHGVLHPVHVVAVGEVLARVRPAALLAPLRAVHGDLRVGHQVVQLQRLDQVRVPHQAAVRHLQVVQAAGHVVDLDAPLRQRLLRAEHGGVVLHGALHRLAHHGRAVRPVGVPHGVQVRDGVLARVRRDHLVRPPRLQRLRHGVGARPPEHHDVQQRVGAQAVGAVHGGAGALPGGQQPRHHGVGVAVRADGHHLALVVGGDAAHVVVHGGDHGDGLLGHVHAGEDGGGLGDAGQALGQELRGQVVEVQVDVVLVGAHAAALADLDGHGAAHHVAARQVLGGGRVPLHEALALAVAQHAALAAGPLRDEAPGAVDARGVELHKLQVLQRQPRARHHGVAVPRARVRGGGGEVRAPVAARGQDGLVRAEAVDGAVLHAQRHDAHALALVHDEVQRKVLHKELRVVLERLPVQRVQHGVPRAVRRARAPVRLPALAEVQRLPAERALVDLAVVRAREGQPVVLQLDHRLGGLAAHVLDGVLVPQPVRALDGVVRVPAPVVLAHVAQRGVDAALRRHRVRPRGKQLGDARSLEAVLRQADGGAQAGAARAHHHGVILVVDDCVARGARCLGGVS
mmetsp:Transcript_27816/g.68381  ORF Transcript_27816/g.68381 Transcript_27816/m.68381 type:complete len:665 (+) Transcript_27816:128-2122(+)